MTGRELFSEGANLLLSAASHRSRDTFVHLPEHNACRRKRFLPHYPVNGYQRIHKRRAGPEKERRADSFPFLGLYVCGDCGGAITGERQKGHHYYRCTKKKGPCSLKCIREEVFADKLSEGGFPMTLRDEGASAVSSIFDQWETEERAEASTALSREQARITDLDARLNRLLDV